MITVDQNHSNPIIESSSNQNFLDQNGLIQNIYRGKQTGLLVKRVGQKLLRLATILRAKNRPVLILTDTSKLGGVNLTARKIGLELMRDLDYDRCAIVGCNFATSNLVNLMINTSGRGFKIRIFESKADAKSWLKS